MDATSFDSHCMTRALELARRGEGWVEPNPMVGCVVAREGTIIAEGFHERFGGPHAEVNALRRASAEQLRGATLYVTLEPCCHFGKTPPCSKAIIEAGISRVVAALQDPFPRVAGGGFAQLRLAGIEVEAGLMESAARELLAPYLKRVEQGSPWIIAKWAMTLDGKLAARTGHSQWISGEESRAVVHALRGRVDAIVVGRGTAMADDPLLTVRPAGPRTPLRIVLDRQARLPVTSRLAQTARETPVLIAAHHSAEANRVMALRNSGCEVWLTNSDEEAARWQELALELSRREMTNVLVEGGSHLFGMLRDHGWIDEVHAFIAPKLIGGSDALSPIAGRGEETMSNATLLRNLTWRPCGNDMYLSGRIAKK